MVDFKRLVVWILIVHMSAATTKTCWPELVGKTADEAVQVIKDESGRNKRNFSFCIENLI